MGSIVSPTSDGNDLGLSKRLRARVRDAPRQLQYMLHPAGFRSVRSLRTYRGRHSGGRCFILGNGPSLNKMDLSPLESELTFGLNRIYMMFEKLGFSTSYVVSVNDAVLRQCAPEIQALRVPKFVSWRSRSFFDAQAQVIFLRSISERRFSTDPAAWGVWEGATVTFVAMQLAFYMGFKEIILIGVDHNFSTKGPANQLVTSRGDDPNHFDPNYFGKGFKWHLPDLYLSEVAYRLAKNHYERAGRSIVDATVGGKLEVFPKVNYASLFQ